MNKIIAKTLILSAIISLNALATEKMTYEQAMQSHKSTYGKYSQQSITEAQSQQSWDTYKQEPVREGSNNVKSYTVLYENTAGLGGGNFVLSQPYSNFDYIEIYGTNDSNEQGAVTTWTSEKIDFLQSTSTSDKALTLWYTDNEYWTGKFSTNKQTFNTYDENAKIRKIIGVNE